jgi:UDP-2-acetamido-2-deoxy-ribo-hexuluronate aminotransferase
MSEFTEDIKFPIQMYDPSRTHTDLIEMIMVRTMREGKFINGPEVVQLEGVLKEYVVAPYALTCANGTDALFLCMKALDIGTSDEVLTVAHSWISTAETIAITGATPIWIDVDDTFCMNPDLIEERITPRTKAIVVVSLYGFVPDYEKIFRIAEKHGLQVIEDGAQSMGASTIDSNGEYYSSCSCKYTHFATTSFFPTKPLGCYGDGGAVFCRSADMYTKIKAIKSHGGIRRFEHEYIGINSRLDTIQASLLLHKLPTLDKCIEERNNVAKKYIDSLNDVSGLTLPNVPEFGAHAWAQFSILADSKERRDLYVQTLKENSVNVAIFYPVTLKSQKCFEGIDEGANIPSTESICDRIFNVPIYNGLKNSEIDYICEIIKNI